MKAFIETSAGNPGRGAHRLARLAAQTVASARRRVARLINAPDASRIIFTLNATDAIHIALDGLLETGDRVLVSPLEHNAVMRPLREWARRGAAVDVARAENGRVVAESFRRARDGARTRLVVCAHASNVNGAVAPVREIARIAHEDGGLILVDAAQSAGHVPIDVRELGADMVAFSGHKGLMGPTGTGALYVAPGVELRPVRSGGTGTASESEEQPEEYPYHLESGTPNTVGLAGLDAALAFIEETGLSVIEQKRMQLMDQIINGINEIKGVEIVRGPAAPRIPLVSLAFDRADPHDVAAFLDARSGVAVRAGLHCAPAAHRALGTFPGGTLRVSPGYFNTPSEIEIFLRTLGEAIISL